MPASKIFKFAISFVLFLIWFLIAENGYASWSLRGNMEYLYMSMNEYQKYKSNRNGELDMPLFKNFHNAIGGSVEIRHPLFKKLSIGVEFGLIKASTKWNHDFIYTDLETREKFRIALFSIPFTITMNYYLLKKNKSALYYGNGLGFWYSKLTFFDNVDISALSSHGFDNRKTSLSSNNISFDFQIGYEYLILKNIGIHLRTYYRFANFRGFKGKENGIARDFDNKTNNLIQEINVNHATRLIFNKTSEYWGPGDAELRKDETDGKVNLGNWGLTLGVLWNL